MTTYLDIDGIKGPEKSGFTLQEFPPFGGNIEVLRIGSAFKGGDEPSGYVYPVYIKASALREGHGVDIIAALLKQKSGKKIKKVVISEKGEAKGGEELQMLTLEDVVLRGASYQHGNFLKLDFACDKVKFSRKGKKGKSETSLDLRSSEVS